MKHKIFLNLLVWILGICLMELILLKIPPFPLATNSYSLIALIDIFIIMSIIWLGISKWFVAYIDDMIQTNKK